MKNLTFNIIKNIAILSRSGEWQKEVNMVSWNDSEPKIDIRSWNKDHNQMSKGITFTEEEFKELLKIKPDK